jgi:hypothetical protein
MQVSHPHVDPLAATQRMLAFADTVRFERPSRDALAELDPESPVARRLRANEPCVRPSYMFGLAAAVAFVSAASLLG